MWWSTNGVGEKQFERFYKLQKKQLLIIIIIIIWVW